MGVIYLLHPMLGMFAIASAIVLVSLTMLTEARTSAPTRQASQSGARRQAYGDSAQRNAEIIQAMGLRDRMLARWEAINERYLVDQLAITDTATGIGTVSKVLRLLLQSGILGLGAYLVIKDELSAGALIAASIILSRALAPIEIAIANWKGFVGFRQSVRRLDKLLDALPQSPSPLTLPRPNACCEAAWMALRPISRSHRMMIVSQ
jgi:ATP-binding cassette subfamily C protein